MTTTFRTRAAVCAAGTAIAAALSVVGAPTAAAADQWGGIATGPGGKWQIWFNKNSRGEANYFGNWASCGSDCRKVLIFPDCGALAYDGNAFSAAEGGTQGEAEAAATADLPGSSIVASACNNGGPSGTNSWKS